jgi:hypothetical protein
MKDAIADTLLALAGSDLDKETLSTAVLAAGSVLRERAGGISDDHREAIAKVLRREDLDDGTRLQVFNQMPGAGLASLMLPDAVGDELQVALVQHLTLDQATKLIESLTDTDKIQPRRQPLGVPAKVELYLTAGRSRTTVLATTFFKTEEETHQLIERYYEHIQPLVESSLDPKGTKYTRDGFVDKYRSSFGTLRVALSVCPVAVESWDKVHALILQDGAPIGNSWAKLLQNRLGNNPLAWKMLFLNENYDGTIATLLAGIEGATQASVNGAR